MSSEKSELYTVIIFISATFFIIVIRFYYHHKQLYKVKEKNKIRPFETELLKTRLEVQAQTMQAVATDLHDNIGQLLSLAALTLNSITLKEDELAKKKIGNSLVLVNKSIKELRELAKLFNGRLIISQGIGYAIQHEINWLKRKSIYTLKVNNQLPIIDRYFPDKDLIILRLFQEIISNIIKHAQASIIEINLHLSAYVLYLNVADNGIGFNYEEVKHLKKGTGLYAINKRIEMINGQINISSKPNEGTFIFIEIPYQ